MILEYLFLPAYETPMYTEVVIVITLALSAIVLTVTIAHLLLHAVHNRYNDALRYLLKVLSERLNILSLLGMFLVTGLILGLETLTIDINHVCATVVLTVYYLTLLIWTVGTTVSSHRQRWY